MKRNNTYGTMLETFEQLMLRGTTENFSSSEGGLFTEGEDITVYDSAEVELHEFHNLFRCCNDNSFDTDN